MRNGDVQARNDLRNGAFRPDTGSYAPIVPCPDGGADGGTAGGGGGGSVVVISALIQVFAPLRWIVIC